MINPTTDPTAVGTVSTEDGLLRKKIQRAFQDVEMLRVLDAPIEVRVRDGVATLEGIIATHAIRAQALEAARHVPGVREVRDELRTDSELEIQIAQALSRDPRTSGIAFDIIVNANEGLVNLAGRVPSLEVAEAAKTVTANVAGVRAVANRLQIGSGDKENESPGS